MGRPKKIPEYVEGPQAAANFTRAMQTIIAAGRPKMLTEHKRVTTQVTVETQSVATKRRRTRNS